MPESHLRAGDSDRAAVAELLGRHMSAGRLTLEEFDERLSRAYAAKTFGELEELTTDLPALGRQSHAAAQETAVAAGGQRHAGACVPAGRHDPAQAWRSWLTTALIVLTIWATTSLASWELHYFWPVWVIAPWGLVLLAQTVGRGGGRQQSEVGNGRQPRLPA